MRIAVVILNWNTRDYLKRWLPDIIGSCSRVGDASAIVADNGSSDGSLEMLSMEFPQVETIPLGSNLGFTGGYNKAFSILLKRHPELQYLVLINSDIDVSPDWLEVLTGHMDNHPECAVCGPKFLAMGDNFTHTQRFEYAGAAGGLIDRFGYPFCRGRVLGRTEEDKGQYERPADVMWVSGACLMTRASLWGSGLDERFFAHMEEIDYCWRKQTEGFKVSIVPSATVWHLGGGTLKQGSPFKLKLNYRNNLLMLENNLPATVGVTKARLIIFSRMVLDGASAIIYLLTGRREDFKAVIEAHNEYRTLRRGLIRCKAENGVCGYWKINIILQSLLRGERVFDYLRKYENNH